MITISKTSLMKLQLTLKLRLFEISVLKRSHSPQSQLNTVNS